MAQHLLKFRKGTLDKLKTIGITPGTIYVTTDERAMYVDVADGKRIRLGDFQEYTNWSAIQAINPDNLQGTALYYAKEENVLAKYNTDTKTWTQINPDTYVNSVAVATTSVTGGATVQTTVTNGGGTTTSKTDAFDIVGAGATTVTPGDKKITISSTDRSVTSVDYHYNPKDVVTNKQIAASTNSTIGDAAEATAVVTGITTDTAGHIIELKKDKQYINAVNKVETTVPENTSKAVVTTNVQQKTGGNYSDNFTIVGGGYTTVSVDKNKQITISSTDTRTSKDGHYTPTTADATSALSVPSGKIISKANRDNRGHLISFDTTDENKLNSVQMSAGEANGKVTVTTAVTDTLGTAKEGNVGFFGSGATTVTVENGAVKIHSVDNDSHTDEAGHYAPTKEDAAKKQQAGAGNVISAIKLDSKNHVIGIEESAASDITGVDVATTGTANNVSVTTTVTSTTGSVADNIKVTGSGYTTVTVTGEGFNIASTDERVSSVDKHYKATGASAGTHSATGGKSTAAKATTQVINGVTTDAAGHVTGITSVGIQDTHANISSVTIGNNANNGFNVTVTDTDGVSKTGTYNPAIKLQNDTSYTLKNGVFNLPVYTATEIDEKIGDAIANTSAMVLRGGLDSENSLPTNNFAGGDTYLVMITGTYQGQIAEAGDLFVAKYDSSDERYTGTKDDWYYVSSGNDITKIEGIATTTEQGFRLIEGSEDAPTPGSKVLFVKSDSQIEATVQKGSSEIKVSFDMFWDEF